MAAYATYKRTPQGRAQTIARKQIRAVKYATTSGGK